MSVLEAEHYTTPIGNILLCDTNKKAIWKIKKKKNAEERYLLKKKETNVYMLREKHYLYSEKQNKNNILDFLYCLFKI